MCGAHQLSMDERAGMIEGMVPADKDGRWEWCKACARKDLPSILRETGTPMSSA